MKKKFVPIVVLFILICGQGIAQQHAVTDSGKNVTLNSDGTWVYEAATDTAVAEKIEGEIDLTKLKKCSKPALSNMLVKSTKNKTGVWYNNKTWRKMEHSFSPAAEYSFVMSSSDGYCMVINEGMELSNSMVKEAIVTNAKNLSADFEILSEEYRLVNGRKIMALTSRASKDKVKFKFLYYIYTGEEGTTQLIAYTSENLFEKAKKEFESLLNGFVVFAK